MTTNEIKELLIGTKVISNVYGDGTVRNVDGTSSNLHISIDFVVDGNVIIKTFAAQIAISRGSIIFEDDDVQEVITEYLSECDEVTKVQQNPPINKNIVFNSNELSLNKHINHLVSKVMNDDSITTDLINLFDDNIFENELLTEGYASFEKIMSGYSLRKENYMLVIVMLTFIALKYYDGDFHSQIKNNYRKYRPDTNYKFTDNSIINWYYKILDKYGFVEKVKYFPSKNKRYDAVANIMACVPYYRVDQLYRLSYDIYKKKLLFDEDVTDDQIEDKVSECLEALKRKDLISDSDTIKGTEYLMSKYTQSCIYSGYNVGALVKIISHCIRLIINHLTRLEDTFNVELFYKQGYDIWTDLFDSNDKEKEKYETSRILSRPYFRLKNKTQIYLITGEYCMDDKFNPENVSIDIYNDDKLIKSYKLDGPNDITFNNDTAMGGYIIARKEIVLDCSPLDYLSYRINCDGQDIYNSKSRLYRTAVFFDGSGKEVKPGTDYNGALFAVVKNINDAYGDTNDSYEQIYDGSGYKIYIVEVNNTDVFRFGNEPYVFYKIQDPKLIGYQVPWAAFTSMEDKKYPIYKDISVLFQATCDKEEIYITVDGNPITFGEANEDMQYKIYLFANEYNGLYAYMIKIYNIESGFHNLKIYNGRTKKLIKNSDFNFIYDENLGKKFVSKDNQNIKYDLESSFMEDNEIIDYSLGSTLLQKHIFVNGLGHGQLDVYPSTICYSIDNVNWFDLDNKFYLCDLPQNVDRIYICGPDNLKAYIIDKNSYLAKRSLNTVQDEKDPFKYVLYLSYIRTLKNVDRAKISFEYGTKSKYFIIWFTPYIKKKECNVFYDKQSKSCKFDISYEGKCKLWLIVKPTNEDNIIFKRQITS